MLKVERIILKGVTGMGLHEIAKFDFTITTPVTIILGGNGCGKTTLLSLYLPLCPAKTDLSDGGEYTNYSTVGIQRFKFHVRRKGSSLICCIDNLTTGENVVQDVNSKVYNTHVESLTGLTKEIKELLNGETRLSRANTPLRKAWFSKMSTSDLSYALGFYTRLRKHYNALGNQIDYVVGKIADSKNRVVEDTEARGRLEVRMEDMQTEISQLNRVLEKRPPTDRSLTVANINEQMTKMSKIMDIILAGDAVIPTQEMIDEENRLLLQGREWVASSEATLKTYNRELSLLLDEQNRQSYLMRNHGGLEETIKRLGDEVVELDKRSHLYADLFDSSRFVAGTLAESERHAREFTNTLTSLVDRLQTSRRLKDMETELESYDVKCSYQNEKILRCENVIRNLRHDLKHYHDTSEVDCPQCQFHFRPGVTRSLEALTGEHNENERYLRELKADQETLLRERSEVEEEVKCLREIRSIVMAYSRDPVLSILFKKLQEEEAFITHRSKFGSLVMVFFDEVSEAQQYQRLAEQLEKARREWQEAAMTVGNVDAVLPEKIRRLEERIQETTQTLSEHRTYAQEKNQSVTRLSVLNTSVGAFKAFYEDLQRSLVISSNTVAIEHLNQIREDKLDAYATARDRYRQMTNELDQLAVMEKELAELQEERHHAKMMINAWSPESGVLRKYYYKAIVRITEMMNHYVDLVWTYPMRVQPCDMTDGELDYLFPFTLKDKVEPAPDVSKGSKAQSAMFDLAYRLTSYKGLNLQKYPLLLDEPSEGMDESHRHRLVEFIKHISSSGEFSQVIIVSHDSDVHSKLNEAAYCVVEPEGITLPDVYNQHVRIEYAE
ncbi:hypothetical protein pEaSNUABM11_00211 [Erwinia phage pEa_SNUABM_11]|nr:hypothetical protein pEaSNUABM11_00211 [Erwinia phage pEa_SNUABM_11]